MSTIEIDGFLSSEVQRHLNECRRRYASWFELITRINRFGQSLLTEVRVDPINMQQSMAGLLYVQVVGHAQGAVLLIERCMPTQGEVLCRASLEALFGLMRLSNGPTLRSCWSEAIGIINSGFSKPRFGGATILGLRLSKKLPWFFERSRMIWDEIQARR